MKRINFIIPLSFRQVRAIRRWYFFSLCIFFCVLCILMLFSIPAYIHFLHIRNHVHVLQAKTSHYEAVLKQKMELEKQESEAQEKKNRIMKYYTGTKNPHSHLQLLTDACKGGVVETIRITKGTYEVIGRHKTMQEATHYAQVLNESLCFTNVQLTNLSHDVQKKEFRYTLKGNLLYT